MQKLCCYCAMKNKSRGRPRVSRLWIPGCRYALIFEQSLAGCVPSVDSPVSGTRGGSALLKCSAFQWISALPLLSPGSQNFELLCQFLIFMGVREEYFD